VVCLCCVNCVVWGVVMCIVLCSVVLRFGVLCELCGFVLCELCGVCFVLLRCVVLCCVALWCVV
jgi:hypothetical protein